MRKYCCYFSDLLNKTLTSVKVDEDCIIFMTSDNEKYEMFHEQECCENVFLEDVCGDWEDLIGVPLLLAEEVSNEPEPEKDMKEYMVDESCTWTFYKLSTIKGSVTIRWFGSSNGFYSETAELHKVEG
jgi:hypothetical protein